MATFYRKEIGQSQLESDNRSLPLSHCLELISRSEFKDDLLSLFSFEEIKNDTLTVKGLATVVESVISMDRIYQKIDLEGYHESNVAIIGYDSDNPSSLRLKFSNLPEDFEHDEIEAYTVYSAGHDFLDGTYQMDKFAKSCIKRGFYELVQSNIQYLNEASSANEQLVKNYRLLKDREQNFFLRAITSTKVYKDYNIRLSLFVAVVTLHKLSKRNGVRFDVVHCEYSESFIKIHFETGRTANVNGLGKMSFLLEMSNDEVKREAFKFTGLFSVFFSVKGEVYEVGVQPDPKKQKIKTPLISIPHNRKPATMYAELSKLENYIENAEEEMRKQLEGVTKVSKPDHLRFRLLEVLKRSRDEGITLHRDRMTAIVNKRINKLSELLEMMVKVNELVPEEFDTKQYLRYMYYDILSSGK